MNFSTFAARSALLVTALILGCGDSSAPSTAEKPKSKSGGAKAAADQEDTVSEEVVAKPKKKKFQPVQLGGDTGGGDAADAGSAAKPKLSGEKRSRAIINALQPLQI